MSDGGTQTKAYFETETKNKIYCLFNPSQLMITRTNSWTAAKRAGRGVPTMAYQGAEGGSMSFKVFFDTTSTGEAVTTHTDALLALMDVDSSLPDSNKNTGDLRPPTVVFHWGDLHSFEAVIKSLTVNLVYFSPTGVPLRADADVRLDQCKDENSLPPQNPTSGTPWPHAVHRVSPGETLDRIAAQHYADPSAWRIIAEANDIRDPLSVPPGTLLAIPGRSA
jgi:LysM repeat protein